MPCEFIGMERRIQIELEFFEKTMEIYDNVQPPVLKDASLLDM